MLERYELRAVRVRQSPMWARFGAVLTGAHRLVALFIGLTNGFAFAFTRAICWGFREQGTCAGTVATNKAGCATSKSFLISRAYLEQPPPSAKPMQHTGGSRAESALEPCFQCTMLLKNSVKEPTRNIVTKAIFVGSSITISGLKRKTELPIQSNLPL